MEDGLLGDDLKEEPPDLPPDDAPNEFIGEASRRQAVPNIAGIFFQFLFIIFFGPSSVSSLVLYFIKTEEEEDLRKVFK